MRKNKSKRIGQQAANSAVTGAAPPSPRNVVPPKLEIEAIQSSKDLEDVDDTMISSYSDEPTLPIIGGSGKHGTKRTAEGEKNNAARKKRKTDTAPKTVANIKGNAKQPGDTSQQPRTDLAPLYEPFTLLPPSLRTALSSRLPSFHDNIVQVVFTKNANIKSGINKLKIYLGWSEDAAMRGRAYAETEDTKLLERLGKKETVVAATAQGDGITKLVGIVETAKRVVQLSEAGDDGQVQEWYMYTSLASRIVRKEPKQRKRDVNGEVGKVGEKKEEEVFETLADIQERDEREQRADRTVPVLTIWMSKTRIVEFADAFGEQVFKVVGIKEEG